MRPARRDAPANTLSVMLVDDEAAARARLRRLLSEEPDVEIVRECDNGKDAVEALCAAIDVSASAAPNSASASFDEPFLLQTAAGAARPKRASMVTSSFYGAILPGVFKAQVCPAIP